ncbi:MAG TPA: DNA ligase D [Candidatus Limnocylindria bacterium]|nr:DNA ligase D [Candidatus Limnocylindria bacterium]
MPLEAYRSKRDFGRTAEPAGGEPGGDGRRFTVQRHRATALHYDFRLEIDGVLVSWAVPKGPTLDPGERRLAMRTEDHPIEYLDFEGVIPGGQYGAGDVIVWDWGHFEPDPETPDPAAAIRAGELKFSLHGEKMRGRFTIVRTDGRNRDPDREQWLLIHKRDAHAVDGWTAEDHPASVKTGRTNDEVRDGIPPRFEAAPPAPVGEIDLSRADEEPMPDFLPPMRATLASEPFDDPDWLFEVKWDGYRVEAVIRDGHARLWTRNRQDAAAYFPDLAGPAAWIDAREAIVDGEVVALDEEGRPRFSLLQDRTGVRTGRAPGTRRKGTPAPIVFEAFDLLHLDGRSLLHLPLEDRKRLLRSRLREHPLVRYAGHVEADGRAFFAAARQQELEGIVAKLRRSPYEPGARSRSWLKLKARREQEAVVVGWLQGQGSHADLGSLILAVRSGDRWVHAGQVGSGLDARTRRELRTQLDELARDDSPLDPAPRIRGAHWVDPRLVVRVEFAEWTADDLLRQAAFKGVEVGRDPRDVRREREVSTASATAAAEAAIPQPPRSDTAPSATADELAALDALGSEGTWTVGGREVRVTNLDKVLFPPRPGDEQITKRDLLRYQLLIAPTILPYLAGRGVTVHRYPNGVEHKGFWQKDLPSHTPAWVTRWTYDHGREGRKDYPVVDHPATLAWLAQEAAIELHPWTSPTDAPDRPSYALIDIDPGDDTSWEEVLVLARLYRTALGHIGVRGHPKVTGQRGIQVWIGIRRGPTFDDTRDWVERLSRAVGSTVPDLVSWEWVKRARQGRARLDYTQNAVNKTLVAPYSPRPAAGAPVSVPITWDELDDPALRPDRWTIRDVLHRIGDAGDPFRPLLDDEQELPPLG